MVSCRVSALSWSPDGRLLAGSSVDCNRVVVWDVALGMGAALRLGLEPITCLSWSPDRSYLFAGARLLGLRVLPLCPSTLHSIPVFSAIRFSAKQEKGEAWHCRMDTAHTLRLLGQDAENAQ